MPVVTIARQFGAGGETVGRMLADRLGADFLDTKLMDEVARRLELSPPEVAAHDERAGSLLHRLLTALGSASLDMSAPPEVVAWTPPFADPGFDTRKAILKISQEVIREAARTGNAVIVGRGSAYILRSERDVLHVFLQAGEQARLRTVMELFSLSEADAARRIKQTDANRAAYVRQIYGHDWRHASHYDMVLDTGRLGYGGTVEAIIAALRNLPG